MKTSCTKSVKIGNWRFREDDSLKEGDILKISLEENSSIRFKFKELDSIAIYEPGWMDKVPLFGKGNTEMWAIIETNVKQLAVRTSGQPPKGDKLVNLHIVWYL